MIMELLLDTIGYAFVALVLGGIFYLFYKILAQGFSAFTKNDD